MRKTGLVSLAAAIVLGTAQVAGATVTFSLVWVDADHPEYVEGLGTHTVLAQPGDILTLEIRMTTDQTLAAHGVSLAFDTDLENELNLYPYVGQEWAGTSYGTTSMVSTYKPLVSGLGPPAPIESTASVAGRINTYESGKSPSGAFLPTGTYVIGTAKFVVNAVAGPDPTDGFDVFVGLFNTGVDDVLNNANAVIPASSLVFEGARVFSYLSDWPPPPVPEPETASLLVLGLLGLARLARRRRDGSGAASRHD